MLPELLIELDDAAPGRTISHHDQTDADGDRLIFLADAVTLVPFSETTLRRAIARGELQAWQPNRDGKLVMWRSALIEWATRRPATDREESEKHRERRLAGASVASGTPERSIDTGPGPDQPPRPCMKHPTASRYVERPRTHGANLEVVRNEARATVAHRLSRRTGRRTHTRRLPPSEPRVRLVPPARAIA